MATVLIVSKTRMAAGVCVGGVVEESGELIRVHNSNGGNLREDAPYEIGDRWSMVVQTAWNTRPVPHVEDRQTTPLRKIGNVGITGIIDFVRNRNLGKFLVRGSLGNTFEGCLHLEGSTSFVNRERIPSFSTQFWIADQDLVHSYYFDKHYYLYQNKRLKFVGLQPVVERIPAGTILRLSLANWWSGDNSGEERCYLQLSGWYL